MSITEPNPEDIANFLNSVEVNLNQQSAMIGHLPTPINSVNSKRRRIIKTTVAYAQPNITVERDTNTIAQAVQSLKPKVEPKPAKAHCNQRQMRDVQTRNLRKATEEEEENPRERRSTSRASCSTGINAKW